MLIRKIAVGSDYKNSMNYIIGQSVLGDKYVIDCISEEVDGSVYIWIKNMEEGIVVRWKKFNSNIPISFEYNINF